MGIACKNKIIIKNRENPLCGKTAGGKLRIKWQKTQTA
jgi:hypothetical protein